MRHLIHSPLLHGHPMSDQEWQQLLAREEQGIRRRETRHKNGRKIDERGAVDGVRRRNATR